MTPSTETTPITAQEPTTAVATTISTGNAVAEKASPFSQLIPEYWSTHEHKLGAVQVPPFKQPVPQSNKAHVGP